MRLNYINQFEDMFEEKCFDSLILTMKNFMGRHFIDGYMSAEINYDPNKAEYKYLELVFDLIESGVSPSCLKILLNYKLIELMNEFEFSKDEMMKCLLIKEMAKFMQEKNIREFITISEMFTSREVKKEIKAMKNMFS